MTQTSIIKKPLEYAEYKEFNLDEAKLCSKLVYHAREFNRQIEEQGKGKKSELRIPEEIQGSKMLWGHSPFLGSLGAKIYNLFKGKDAISALLGFTCKDNKGSIYVVFRGTNYISEWYNNLFPDLKPCKLTNDRDLGYVHWGFYSIYDTLKEDLMKQLNEYQKASPQCSQIYFTGYSLGGALSTVAMLDVMNNFVMPMNPQQRPKMVQYTFGSPKVGDKQFAEAFKSKDVNVKCFQIINTTDLVPYLPKNGSISLSRFVKFLPSFRPKKIYENHGELVEFTIDYKSRNKNHNLDTYRESLEHV